MASMIAGNATLLWTYALGLLLGATLYSIVATVAVRRERRRGEFKGILYDEEDR